MPPMKYMDLLAQWAAIIRNHQPIISIEIVNSVYEIMNQQHSIITAEQTFDDGLEQSARFLLNTLQFSQL